MIMYYSFLLENMGIVGMCQVIRGRKVRLLFQKVQFFKFKEGEEEEEEEGGNRGSGSSNY